VIGSYQFDLGLNNLLANLVVLRYQLLEYCILSAKNR
jgi:hypothetical protein